MKRTGIIIGVAVAVVVWLGIGILIAKGPQPEIKVPAEVLWKLGPLNVTNTLFTAWIVMAFLVIVSFIATRAMRLAPGGLQNFMEAVVGFLVDQVEEIAGEKNGRRFFVVVATIFLFVITANWAGLLPFFNAIGKTDDVGHEIFVQLSSSKPDKLELTANGTYDKTEKFAGWKMDETGGVVFAKSGAEAVDFEVEEGETPGRALDRYIVFLAHNFAKGPDGKTFPATEEERTNPSDAMVRAAAAALANTADAPKLIFTPVELEADQGPVTSPVLGQAVYGVSFEDSQKLALVVPFFRGVYSDVNNTLALGLIAFVMIEFWGLQSLGFSYLKKFFNFSSPINFGVGVLELLSEFIRIISFAFRLFGNIFAGEVLVLMITFLMPFLFVDIIYGLELFVGFIQAAVFALLTLVFAAMAVEHHDESGHHDDDEAGAEPGHHQGTAQAH